MIEPQSAFAMGYAASILAALTIEAGRLGIQQLREGRSELWSLVKDRVFSSSRHEELKEFLENNREEVRRRIEAVAEKDTDFKNRTETLAQKIHAEVHIQNSSVNRSFVAGAITAEKGDIHIHVGEDKGTDERQEINSSTRIDNLPPRNPNFTGRVELLGKLRERLVAGEATALHGLGGIGKTQVSLKYADQYSEDYKIIWRLRAEETASLGGDLAELARELKLPEANEQDQRITIAAVRKYLHATTHNWLLIFDNAEKPEGIKDYLPGGDGHVLITSRHSSWRGVAKPLEVEKMSPEDAKKFLTKRSGDSNEEAAANIAEELDYLPLALEQAGAYVEQSGCRLAGYFKLYQEKQLELLKSELAKPEGYPKTVLTTWLISIKKVKEQNSNAADLLNLCAFFAPDDIPLDVITEQAKYLPESLAACMKDQKQLDEAIAALRSYSLVNRDGDNLFVHRLVQAVTRAHIFDDAEKDMIGSVLKIINRALPDDSYDVQMWGICDRLLTHGMTIVTYPTYRNQDLETVVRILNQCACYVLSRARYSEAFEIFEQLSPLAKRVFGENNSVYARVIGNLGTCNFELGNLDNAKTWLERALEIIESIPEYSHVDQAMLLNNLGHVHFALGKTSDARRFFERAIEASESCKDRNMPHIAIYLNSLGSLLQSLGDLKGAKDLYERALDIDKTFYGVDHPNVAIRLNNIGSVLLLLHDYKGARKLAKQSYEIFLKRLGPDHPRTKKELKNLRVVPK